MKIKMQAKLQPKKHSLLQLSIFFFSPKELLLKKCKNGKNVQHHLHKCDPLACFQHKHQLRQGYDFPICNRYARINTWRADSVVWRGSGVGEGASKGFFSRMGSGLKTCWFKVNFCVICSALSNTTDFCPRLDGKNRNESQMFFHFCLFLVFHFSTDYCRWGLSKSSQSWDSSSFPSLLSQTVDQLQKTKSKALISSLWGKRKTHREPPRTTLSPHHEVQNK